MNLLDKIRIHGIRNLIGFAKIEGKAKFYKKFYNSFSQAQEDLVIDKLLGKKKSGFYVDIGATDGIWYSNTHYFYNKGWRGINIEPDPENFPELNKNRKEDINLPIGIATKTGQLRLKRFSLSVLNTFSDNVTNEFVKTGYKLIEQIDVPVDTLENIFDKFVQDKKIDFMTLDTEGFDLIVLQSNNWKKYKPKLICVECEEKHQSEGRTRDDDIHQFLTQIGYTKVFDNKINSIYLMQTD